MTEAVLFKIGCVVAGLIGYGLVRWRLMKATHEFRVRAGCDADRWATDPRVPEETRRALQSLADGMYRPMMPWLVVLATLIAVFMPYRRFEALMLSLDPGIRKDIARLNARLFFAAIATSPLAGFFTLFILLVGLLVRESFEAVGQRIQAVAGTYPHPLRAYPLRA